MEDKRFAHIATDPKFRRIPKGERKVKIDKRFQSMFKDRKFKVKYTVDKRGRPVNHSTSEDLKRYYELTSESEEEESDAETKSKSNNRKLTGKVTDEGSEDIEIIEKKKKLLKKKSEDVRITEKKKKLKKESEDFKLTQNKKKQLKKGSDDNDNFAEKKNKKKGKDPNKKTAQKEEIVSDEDGSESEELNSDDGLNPSSEENADSDLGNEDSDEDVDSENEYENDEESSGIDSEDESTEKSEDLKKENRKNKDNSLNKIEKFDKEIPKKVKKKLKNLKIDYARGEGKLLTDSSSDDESEEEEISDSEGIDHKWGELDADAERVDEPTRRFAACNMDWDRIRATDLMVLFNSFLPTGAQIESVKIYTSEFGKQRLAEEDIKGPIELVDSKENEDETEEGAKYHMEKLRQYQLNRLKYYYAVVTCDSANTANKIYTECDGMEYESSATKIDLRFIPDDMEFEDEPKEVCEKLPELNKYKPRFFTTTALQQAKVDLTWDETDPDRLEITQKLASGKVDEISENDLQAYLASSSGEDEEEEEEVETKEEDFDDDTKNPIDKYKALLLEIENKEKAKDKKDVGMEISWGIDLESKTEKLVKKKMEEQENKTPFQKYLDKRKEKRKMKKEAKKQNDEGDESSSDVPSDIDMNDPYFAEEFNKPEFKNNKKKKEEKLMTDTEDEDEQRNAELELLLMNDDDGNKKHFSLKKIQDGENEGKTKKRNKKKGKTEESQSKDDFKINVEDERFSALFTSHHYNIDPTDSHFKKTKNMEILINEKIKRRNYEDDGPESKKVKSSGKKKAELSVLVKSVKRKAEAFTNKK